MSNSHRGRCAALLFLSGFGLRNRHERNSEGKAWEGAHEPLHRNKTPQDIVEDWRAASEIGLASSMATPDDVVQYPDNGDRGEQERVEIRSPGHTIPGVRDVADQP